MLGYVRPCLEKRLRKGERSSHKEGSCRLLTTNELPLNGETEMTLVLRGAMQQSTHCWFLIVPTMQGLMTHCVWTNRTREKKASEWETEMLQWGSFLKSGREGAWNRTWWYCSRPQVSLKRSCDGLRHTSSLGGARYPIMPQDVCKAKTESSNLIWIWKFGVLRDRKCFKVVHWVLHLPWETTS